MELKLVHKIDFVAFLVTIMKTEYEGVEYLITGNTYKDKGVTDVIVTKRGGLGLKEVPMAVKLLIQEEWEDANIEAQ